MPSEPDAPPASVRERLETTETRIMISAEDSAGSITAQRRIAGAGWEAGLVDLAIETGELVATADADGTVRIERLGVSLAPIDIPRAVFDKPAQLTHVRIGLAAPASLATTWTSDDDVRATASLELTMSWAITIDGSTALLGEPDLPPVPVELVLSGTGERVVAELRAHAPGEVWSWATLLKFEDLSLVLGGATVETR